jgi:membrane-associated phospholipid phosphatase
LVEVLKRETDLWAVDKVIIAYLVCSSALVVAWWRDVPDALYWICWHAGLILVLLLEIKLPNPTSWIFRNWYPVVYVASCYKEMADYLPLARHVNFDQALANIDARIWGVQPAVWLYHWQTPILTEYLQTVYTLFVPAAIFPAFLLWRAHRYKDFRYLAFLIAIGYLASYVGYILVPARGPRVLFTSLESMPLRGLWLFHGMQALLDRLESIAYDCFPSGHTELTVIAWWSVRQISRPWFFAYSVYTLSIIFATVYLRYHYSIDVFAGALLAAILIAVSPSLYQKLRHEV